MSGADAAVTMARAVDTAAASCAPRAAGPAVAVRRSWWRRPLRLLERFFAILGVLLLVYLLCFDLSVIVSGSMSPTLRGNGKPGSDYVLSEKVSYRFRSPRRWELVAFHSSDGLFVMKRVVALPGESIRMERDGTIFINGERVERPERLRSIRYYAYGTLAVGSTAKAGDGFFVLGDDSKDSQDSRWEKPVSWEAIRGRPWLIVWPPHRMGFANK
jgi:signal peptidase I